LEERGRTEIALVDPLWKSSHHVGLDCKQHPGF
jgi:hypothetical protein